MKSFLVTAFVIIMTLGLTSQAMAAPMTLDDCIELALKTRASIVRARGNEISAAADQRSALGAFLPSLSAQWSWSKGKETDIEPGGYHYTAFGEVFDTFDVGGETHYDHGYLPTDSVFAYPADQDLGPSKQLWLGADATFSISRIYSYAAAKANHARAKLDVIASEQDLIYSVKVAYYAYLANVQNLETQQEAVKRADEQLKLIESRFELGSAARSDVLKQKVQYGNDRLALLKAVNAVTNSRANLAYTVGLDPRDDHEFDTEYNVREYDGTLDEAISFGVNHNPSLLSQQKTVDWAKHSARAAKATWLPSVSGSYSISKFDGTQNYPEVFDYSSVTKRWGFSFNWNIFDGFSRHERIQNAKVSHNNSRADFADLRNYTVSNIKTGYSEIDQYKEQKAVSEENVAAADEDLKITQEKYNLGAATILDLLDAQVSLKEAQVSLISVDFDLNLAIAKLEKSMGKM